MDTKPDERPTYCSFMILDHDKKELLAKATELAREQLVAAGWKPEDIEDEALPNYWIYPGGARTYVLNVKADAIPEAQP